ncbi:MAG: hypothetical protein GY750_09675 [Lentisphaerae bacterium]|nr:hypothetical protein [Lentisphaerota bacterium]MCP4101680.1 hypothetical protein [Lentisphaerota bacterium]
MTYYISYALTKTGCWSPRRPGRRSPISGHAQIFLSKYNGRDWEVERAYGLYGRREDTCKLIYGFLTGSSSKGHLKNELNFYTDRNKNTHFYIRNYPIDKFDYDYALELFDDEREIKIEKVNPKKIYRGPDFSVKYFNCHKYATMFLIRLGIIDGFLLGFDYPSAVDKSNKYFQSVTLTIIQLKNIT